MLNIVAKIFKVYHTNLKCHALKNFQKSLKLKVLDFKLLIFQMKTVPLFLVQISHLIIFLHAMKINMKKIAKLKKNTRNIFVKKKNILNIFIKIRNVPRLKRFK